MSLMLLLAGSDCTHGASICASAAVNANIGIDSINFAFFDGAGRALAQAGAASDASVC